MKTILAAVVVVFLFFPPYATAASDPTGAVGFKTVKFWRNLHRDAQLYYLMGALDVLIVSCPGDIATVGAMENVLHNRIRDGIVGLNDLMYSSINKVALDFACTTILPASPDVTPVGR